MSTTGDVDGLVEEVDAEDDIDVAGGEANERGTTLVARCVGPRDEFFVGGHGRAAAGD